MTLRRGLGLLVVAVIAFVLQFFTGAGSAGVALRLVVLVVGLVGLGMLAHGLLRKPRLRE